MDLPCVSILSVLTTAGFDALVGSVRTVFVSITLPVLRDADVRPRTLEGLGTAGLGLCDGKRLMKVILVSICLFCQ